MAAGEAVVRYLAPDKYGIEPLPPASGQACNPSPQSYETANDCSDMLLTATLEGTRGNDAWVRSTEPRYNINLGQLNYLVFYGFVHPMNTLADLPAGTGTPGSITGQVVFVHDAHPPLSPGLNPGLPVPTAYVGLNNLSGNDEQVYTAAADPDTGQFTITDVPPGTYQLAMWDEPINAIIDYRTVTIDGSGGTVALGQIPVFRWFGTLIGQVFYDNNGDGMHNPGDTQGIPNVPVNLRFSDGSIYASTTTGPDGSYSFDQYFAWWRYLVAEVGTSSFKATGLTSVVDDGGPLTRNTLFPPLTGESYASQGINPQRQPDGRFFRSEQGSYTEAIQLFQDMTDRIDFGKQSYDIASGENGGFAGQVNYATTRTEENPANSTLDGWEPGVPNVTVVLHQAVRDASGNWVVNDTAPFPLTTTTTSWDASMPTDCVGTNDLWANPEVVNGYEIPSCAETFHNWDQTRPGVFDGAYSFGSMPASQVPFTPGDYIVEVVPPAGYKVVEWGDRNIEFGDPKIPYLKTTPECVGPLVDVPQYHTLFPDQQVPTLVPGVPDGWQPGLQRPSCNMKHVALNPGDNGAADFNLFTDVPKAARIWGTVWNDLMLEFNPNTPNAAGNLGVSYLPVAIKDWSGHEVARFYTDQWGHFDGLIPSNYDIAPPIPLGLVLAMYTIAPNDPGPILDTREGSPTYGQMITDPWFNPSYSQEVIRENWEFYPGLTTFIDTIVLPTGAFVANRVPLSCDYVAGTPEIEQVSPLVLNDTASTDITITSMGPLTGSGGFGADTGTVTVGGTQVPVNGWSDGAISATVPTGVSGQLVVTNASGQHSVVGITLHTQGSATVHLVSPPPADCEGTACGVIQQVIDDANPGDIVLLAPGSYQENVILWKPLTLQGAGAAVTILDGTAALGNLPLKDAQFNHLQDLIASGDIGIVPGQASDFTLEAGAGILVAGCDYTAGCTTPGNSFATGHARIDGLTITGATEAGGGVLVNGFAPNTRITNNEVFANQGSIGGGIRVGEGALVGTVGNETGSNFNADLLIDHNRIAQNGSLFSGGGGIALYAGSDGYQVSKNMICGNFSAQYGGGIGHFGLSLNSPTTGEPPRIEDNWLVSNESFDEGGGIHIAGDLPAVPATLSYGAGSVVIDRNLIEGNKGGDDGGGIRTLKVNGLDVADHPNDANAWYQVDIANNMVVNNSSADAGGGMAFDDTVKLNLVGNTVANNDSTATSSDAFGGPCPEPPAIPGSQCPPGEVAGGLTNSIPQVGGISSIANSTDLQAVLPLDAADFSDPLLLDNIIWHNRSFYWCALANNGLGALLSATTPCNRARTTPGPNYYWDLGVSGTAVVETMSPTYSLLTDGVGATPSATNLIGTNPRFLSSYFNLYEATSMGAALGNFVVATFTPNGIQGDYHIPPGSPAAGAGSDILYPLLQSIDYDADARLSPVDIGADQVSGAPTHIWPQ